MIAPALDSFEEWLESDVEEETLDPEVHFDLDSGEAEEDDLLATYEREMVQASRRDPVVFFEYALGWRCEPFHIQIQDFLSAHRRAVIFSPNETGKSSQVSFARALWELGRNPNLRIAIGGATADGPEDSLGLVESAILVNPRVALGRDGQGAGAVFPWLRPERRPGRMQSWLKSQAIVEREDLENKDPSIRATGTSGNQEGWRVDLWILDDVLSKYNTATKEQRQEIIRWLTSTVIPRRTALSRMWAIGTPWFDDDALHWLERNREYRSIRFDVTTGIWPKATLVKGKVVGWPEWRWQQRLREIGRLEFDRSMRCRAITDSSKTFHVADFDRCVARSGLTAFPASYDGGDLIVATGMDLGVKDRKSNAETVSATVGLSRSGDFHLLDMRSGRGGISFVVRTLIDVQRDFGPLVQVVENVAAQDYVLQFVRNADEILAIAGAEGLHSLLNHVRVEPITTDAGKKADVDYGITAMAADFEQTRWVIPDTEEARLWRDELDAFKVGEHPGDRVMAAWFAWRRLRRFALKRRIRAMTVGKGNAGARPAPEAKAPEARARRLLVRRPR